MGRKKLERISSDKLLSQISTMLVPAHVLKHFEIWGAREYTDRWVIDMREREGNIPAALREYSDVVFDGFCNPLDTLSHSFVCKPVYLRLYRRRYKRAGKDEHYSNNYDVSLQGVRMVPELGLFLKTED